MKNKNTTQSQLSKLAAFRQSVYGCLTGARDALFELLDAVLTSPRLTSFPELSCAPCFRRQWSSVYAALQDGKLNAQDLLKLELKQLPPLARPLLVGDHTAWGRVQARTLRDRSFVHQPTPIKGQKPISIGHRYSTLGVVPEAAGSWLLPLLHQRIESETTPSAKLAGQLKEVCPLLAERSPGRPLGLFDSEYGSGRFLNQTEKIDCDLLFRVKANRKLRRAPGPYKGKGRPATHGEIFRLSDATTWHRPDEQWECEDEKLGPVKLKRWDDLHFEDAPKRALTLLRVERVRAHGTRRDPRVVWLGYCGEQQLPSQDATWRQYLSRYVIEHWYRFIKQSLKWTLPQLSTPAQSQLWSSLLLIASWQLWLARRAAQDHPRPWQKPQAPEKMTPGRVQRGMSGVLAGIGTPAQAPKPRGKSPGWPVGRVRTKRTRYAVLKKQSQQATQAKQEARTPCPQAA